MRVGPARAARRDGATEGRRRLVLWDIDGTLVSTGPAGRLALEQAAGRAAGLEVVPSVPMAGKTDPQIVREILAAAGVRPADIDRLLPSALEDAHRHLAGARRRMRLEGTVHPGVIDLLEALAGVRGVRQTLLTGNIRPNAIEKVRAFGLEGYFDVDVGAYGSDHADRDCLVPISLERARALRGEVYRPDEVWVIGDTAADLRCARAGGARCVIVGTGQGGAGPVRSLEADAVVDTLADTAFLLRLVLDGVPLGGPVPAPEGSPDRASSP